MEAFEQFVAIALETEGFVVSEAVKFPVSLQTSKSAYDEVQTHGFEVDLIGARANKLILATVKSFFGSTGVVTEHVTGVTSNARWRKRYALLNDLTVRDAVVQGAASRFGYPVEQIQMRLYAGKFAAPVSGKHEAQVRAWCAKQQVGAGAIEVFAVHDVLEKVLGAAAQKQYRDNSVLMTMKVLDAAGVLTLKVPEPAA